MKSKVSPLLLFKFHFAKRLAPYLDRVGNWKNQLNFYSISSCLLEILIKKLI
jgi:hypothetical protein